MMRSRRWLSPFAAIVVAAAGVLAGCAGEVRTADIVLTNGTIVTVDSTRPEAEAVAISGDTIVAVGSAAEIDPFIASGTNVIDLEGRTAVPGFIEGHGHFMGLGRAQVILDLTQARTWGDIVQMVAEAAAEAEPGEWILGRGWHQEKWDERPSPSVEGLPTHVDLSSVSPDNPVYLTHASGHASFVNQRALEVSGVGPGTADPAGGEIVRDADGRATGVMRENAQDIFQEAIAEWRSERSPEQVEADRRRRVELAGRDALSKGVTSFHDAGTSFETIDFFRTLADEDALPIRLYVMVRGATNEEMAEKLPEYRMVGYGNDFLTVRSIKRQIDGALGSHGAWMLEPYADLPRSAGLNLEPLADIRRTAELAVEHDYQLNVHAIGDRANREVLDLYEEIFEANPETDDRRWRIEHAQHLALEDIPRFAELGVIPAMQAIHATSDGPWVVERIGRERAEEGAYVWQKLFESGAVVTNGTDTPVEDIDPIQSFYASVSRRLDDGSVFFPSQRMTREQALRSYTINNAYAEFAEDRKGSITPGKLADIVVLSKNIMTIPEEEIPETRVVRTIVGGEVRYSAEEAIARRED